MITDFLPQAEPFVMTDTLISVSENTTISEFTIKEGHLFVKNNTFAEPGLMENMAQTAAAGTGFTARQNNQNPPVGFIGAIKDWQLFRLPVVGETITTTISTLHNMGSVQVVKAVINCNNENIATAEFKIFLQP